MPVIRRSANAGTATPPEAGSHGAVMEVAAMSLSSHEQHALHSIEDRLCVSAPELASLLATFSRLASSRSVAGK